VLHLLFENLSSSCSKFIDALKALKKSHGFNPPMSGGSLHHLACWMPRSCWHSDYEWKDCRNEVCQSRNRISILRHSVCPTAHRIQKMAETAGLQLNWGNQGSEASSVRVMALNAEVVD
jgi:hypothetical protein